MHKVGNKIESSNMHGERIKIVQQVYVEHNVCTMELVGDNGNWRRRGVGGLRNN